MGVPIIEAAPWTAIIFLMVFASIGVVLMNLVLTVMVDSVAAARDDDLKEAALERKKAMIRGKEALLLLCVDLDEDKSGKLNMEELAHAFQNNVEFSQQMQ